MYSSLLLYFLYIQCQCAEKLIYNQVRISVKVKSDSKGVLGKYHHVLHTKICLRTYCKRWSVLKKFRLTPVVHRSHMQNGFSASQEACVLCDGGNYIFFPFAALISQITRTQLHPVVVASILKHYVRNYSMWVVFI